MKTETSTEQFFPTQSLQKKREHHAEAVIASKLKKGLIEAFKKLVGWIEPYSRLNAALFFLQH